MSTFTPADLNNASAQNERGRGFAMNLEDDRYTNQEFDTLDSTSSNTGLKSVEGWVLFVSGLTSEHSEGDLLDVFSDFGEVNQIIVPFNRITGNPHGFALVQFRDLLSAKDAIKSLDGAEVIGTILNVSWAFQNEKQ